MKKSTSFILAGLFFLTTTGVLWAATVFTLTAVVPAATGVSISVASVVENPTTHAIISSTPVTGTALTYSTMTFDATNKIWTPPNYFAIDIANIGAGSPHVTVAYAEGSKPTSQVQGLGNRATVTYKKVVWVDATHNTETDISGHPKKALLSANDDFLPALTQGGWFKMYVGVATDATVTNASPFTNADLPGTYTGTLTVTTSLT